MEMEMTSLVWEEIERSERQWSNFCYISTTKLGYLDEFYDMGLICYPQLPGLLHVRGGCIISYLVCSMYEGAASSATSVLKRIRDNPSNLSVHDYGNLELYDMMQSADMVLVQSLKELQRTSRILDELRALFVSVEAIPVQVLLTGVCFQILEGSTLGVRELLEEFLCKWRNVDEIYFVLVGAEGTLDFTEGCDSQFGKTIYFLVLLKMQVKYKDNVKYGCEKVQQNSIHPIHPCQVGTAYFGNKTCKLSLYKILYIIYLILKLSSHSLVFLSNLINSKDKICLENESS